MQPETRAAKAALYGGMLVPFAGLAIQLGGMASAQETVASAERQVERVSLGLLHDAGYDIDQAPMAWRLLASKKSVPVSQISFPDRAAYLYRIHEEAWHNPAISTSSPH